MKATSIQFMELLFNYYHGLFTQQTFNKNINYLNQNGSPNIFTPEFFAHFFTLLNTFNPDLTKQQANVVSNHNHHNLPPFTPDIPTFIKKESNETEIVSELIFFVIFSN